MGNQWRLLIIRDSDQASFPMTSTKSVGRSIRGTSPDTRVKTAPGSARLRAVVRGGSGVRTQGCSLWLTAPGTPVSSLRGVPHGSHPHPSRFFFLSRDPRNTHAGQAALPMLHGTRNAISAFPLVSVARRDAEKQPRDWSEPSWREITRSPRDATPSPLPGWMSHAQAVTLSRKSGNEEIQGQNTSAA